MMSVKFNHTAHKEMWTWLSENPEMGKDDWPGWNWSQQRNGYYCFACSYACEHESKDQDWYEISSRLRCPQCPLIWPSNLEEDENCLCTGYGGLYEIWENSDNLVIKKNFARLIAGLPVKDGVETI